MDVVSLNKPSENNSQTPSNNGYPPQNAYPQPNAYPQQNSGYPQPNAYPQQNGGYPQQNAFPQQNSGYHQPNAYPQQNAFPQQTMPGNGAFPTPPTAKKSKAPIVISIVAVVVAVAIIIPVSIVVSRTKQISALKANADLLSNAINDCIDDAVNDKLDDADEIDTVRDVCKEYKVDDSGADFYNRTIGDQKYRIVYNNSKVFLIDDTLTVEGKEYKLYYESGINADFLVTEEAYDKLKNDDFDDDLVENLDKYFGGIVLEKNTPMEYVVLFNSKAQDVVLENAKLSTMESDTASMNMLIKECINTYKADITTTKWNGKTASECTVHDICVENNIDDSSNFYSRTINGISYSMVWTTDGSYIISHDLKVSGGDYDNTGTEISGSTRIVDLAD